MFQELLARLAGSLEAAALPYMLIGGQAVLVHGEVRLTQDIDITLGATVDELDAVLHAARNAGLEPLINPPRDFVRDTWVLPCADKSSGIRVDLIFSFSSYERAAIERAISVPMASAQVKVASAEDLVIMKILAARPRDLEDARTILLRNPQLDRDDVTRHLAELEPETGLPLLARLHALSPQK